MFRPLLSLAILLAPISAAAQDDEFVCDPGGCLCSGFVDPCVIGSWSYEESGREGYAFAGGQFIDIGIMLREQITATGPIGESWTVTTLKRDEYSAMHITRPNKIKGGWQGTSSTAFSGSYQGIPIEGLVNTSSNMTATSYFCAADRELCSCQTERNWLKRKFSVLMTSPRRMALPKQGTACWRGNRRQRQCRELCLQWRPDDDYARLDRSQR